MPPAYTPSQKGAIAQFVGFTQAKDSVATKQLKAHGWNVEQAVDAYVYMYLLMLLTFCSGEESAHDILNLLPSRKSRGSGPVPRKTQRLDRSWRELEKRLAQIPLDKTGRTLQDEDEGHISAQLLATVDPPFDYDLKRFYNNDEFPDWISKHQTVQSSVESLQALFAKWFQAAPEFDLEHEYWSKVPAMLRFAFKRPLMPDKALDHRLREMGLSWSSSYVAWMRRKSKAPSGRKQARLYGIDLEPVDSRRLRARYNNVLGTDWSEDVVSGSNGVRTQDRRYEEKLKSALLKAYATFRKGAFSTDQAIDWYKSLLKMPDISHHDLARRLEGIGIPRVHILGEETTTDEASLPALLQNTCDALKEGHISYETAITHYRSLLDMPEVPLAQVATRLEEFGLPRAHLFGEVSKEASSSLEAPSPSKDESDIMEELENHVKAYRSGFYNLEEAVSFVSARLEGMSVDRPLFSTLISSSDLSPARAAEVIFERAAEESPRSTPSPETNPDNNKEDLKKIAQHFIEEYVESIKGGLDPGIALAEYRDKYGLDDFSSSEVLSIFKQLGIPVDNLPAVGDARATTDTDVVDDLGGPLDSSMPSPKVPMSRERSPNPDSETTAQSDTSSVASGTTLCDSTHSDLPESAVSDWEHCFEGTAGNPNGSDYDLINSSPEQGFSTDLWGLEMPTGQAKKLGEDIGLPAKYVHRRIRSHTPHRKAVTRLRKSSMSLKSLPAKRKASATVHQGRRTRFPKDALGVDVSAEEGNNRDTVGQGESVAGVSLDCAAEQPVLDSPSSCDVTKQSMHNLVKDEALLLEGDIQTGRIGRLTFEAVEIDQFTAVGSGASPDGSDTILEILESDIIQDGILRTDLPLDSESYKDHIRSNASWMKSDIAAKISISQVRPISNDIERRLIVLLCALGRDPSWANVHKLITSVRQGLKEHADAKSATRTIEASIHAGNPKPLFPRPPSVPANNKSQAECSSEANGMLSSSVKIGKRHQRLRLTQPRKPRKPTHNTPGAPFLGTPKDISSIAAENRESFFVCIQRMRRQRPKANHYALENRYFQNPTSLPSSSGSASHLNKLFDKYRDTSDSDPDTIGVDGSMRYLGDLGVQLDEVVLLAVLTELSAPTMGELTRIGFVEGWKTRRANDINAQKAVIRDLRRELPQPDLFRRVYKHTFKLALATGQKSIPLDVATEYWRLLLQPPSINWYTPPTPKTPQASPWLSWWLDYLETRWRKGVSRDMWDQTGKLVFKTMEPGGETMSWWSEDGAWPGVIDQFVEYVREKRAEHAGKMEE